MNRRAKQNICERDGEFEDTFEEKNQFRHREINELKYIVEDFKKVFSMRNLKVINSLLMTSDGHLAYTQT